MSITVEPVPGASVYIDENGQVVFTRWDITSDEGHIYYSAAHTKLAQLAILDYLRERVEQDDG